MPEKDAGLKNVMNSSNYTAQRGTVVPSQNLEIGTQGGKSHVITYQSEHQRHERTSFLKCKRCKHVKADREVIFWTAHQQCCR